MLIDVIRYLRFGWVAKYYIEPSFHFTYYGFHWLSPWPAWGMYAHFVFMGLCAMGIALGYRFRLCAGLFTVAFSYVFLLEKAHYLNHFYVIILLSFLIFVTPAHRLWSLDAQQGRVEARDWTPTWAVLLIRSQLFLIYVFAGVAKLNFDWFGAEPMRLWLGYLKDMPVLGSLIASEPSYYAASYLGIGVDLLLPFFLLFRKTRTFALIAFAGFHLTNALLFSIGIFPWLMLACNLFFLPTSWPRNLPPRLKEYLPLPDNTLTASTPSTWPSPSPVSRLGLTALCLYLGVQVLMPLRHHLYPGDVAWTEEGHRFSWRMKLRDKRGHSTFLVHLDDRSSPLRINPRDLMPDYQYRKLVCEPDMLLIYAAHLSEKHRTPGKPAPRVTVDSSCTLNSHPAGPLIDPKVDLARQEDQLLPVSWILPRP